MSLNVDDELVTKYYDLEEERRKANEAIMEAREKRLIKEIREESLQQGLEQGSIKKQKEMVINMFKDNCSFELISKYTDLPIEEVKYHSRKRQIVFSIIFQSKIQVLKT